MASAAGSRGASTTSSGLASSPRNIGTHNDDPAQSSDSFSDVGSSDDEIVWSVSDISVISAPHTSSDEDGEDDYVLLERAGSPIGVRPLSSGVMSLSASMLESQAGMSPPDELSDVFSRLQVEEDESDDARPVSQATTRRRPRSRPRRSGASTAGHASAQAPVHAPPNVPAVRVTPVTSTTAQAAREAERKAAKAAAKAAKRAAKKAARDAMTPEERAMKMEAKKAKKARKAARKAAKKAMDNAKAKTVKRAQLQGQETALSSSSSSSSSTFASAQTATSYSAESSPAPEARSVSFYQDAVEYISSFLSSSADKTKSKSDLTFLKALIIELGLCPATTAAEQSEVSFASLPSLPCSLRAAKTLLQERVFVNVRDYLDVRDKGLEALQSVMHPSRKDLIKDLSRGKGQRKVPRGVIKESGLGVLLVTCYR